jgi:alginate O-acetyltransferase complex protein AlgI
MLFCSSQFAYFFFVVFAVYWFIPWRRLRLPLPFPTFSASSRRLELSGDEMRVWWLLAASYYFYASWNPWLALLIAATSCMDFVLGRSLEAYSHQSLRKLLLAVSLVVNIGLLLYFKYCNFFLHSLEQVLEAAGATASLPVLKILLPIGISFYTFEAISYTVDVYQRRIRAERNLSHFMLFILFFPHLIAGPIVRGRDFLPQVRRRKRWNWDRFHLGVAYFVLGLLKKWAVADRMALFAEPVFANPWEHSSYAIWIGVLAYALQVYCDFSGYSDMALGTAHMLGYKLAQNFNMPYLAVNISDYWRRWHISLSTWLRDYLYIPLGGSRAGEARTTRNLLCTMTLAGLWHGTSWMYVSWGFLQGVYLVGHRWFRLFARKQERLDGLLQTTPGTVVRLAFTFLCVCAGYVVFRSPNFAAVGEIFHKLLFPHAGLGPVMNTSAFWVTVAGVVLFHAAGQAGWWHKLSVRTPAPVLGLGYALALTVCLILAPHGDRMFIYFQF